MERLTEKHYAEKGYYMKCSETCEKSNCDTCDSMADIVDRLGEYEDMELTPEEFHESVDYILALNKKLKPYLDAEEQGLLVRLPCKVGTSVYFIRKTGFHPELIETKIEEIGVRRGGMFVKLSCNSAYRTAISAWGKTVFLTRAEAEAALAKEG